MLKIYSFSASFPVSLVEGEALCTYVEWTSPWVHAEKPTRLTLAWREGRHSGGGGKLKEKEIRECCVCREVFTLSWCNDTCLTLGWREGRRRRIKGKGDQRGLLIFKGVLVKINMRALTKTLSPQTLCLQLNGAECLRKRKRVTS